MRVAVLSSAISMVLFVGAPAAGQHEAPAPTPAELAAAVAATEALLAERKPAEARPAAAQAWAIARAMAAPVFASDEVQATLWRLGTSARDAGDLRVAHDALTAVLEARTRHLADDHPDLQAARLEVGKAKRMLGDRHGALPLLQEAFDVSARTLPDDHRDLQFARLHLSAVKHELGDLRGALALQEKVLDIWSKALADDDPDLQTALEGLAVTKCAMGDLRVALALFETVYGVLAKTLPDDHPDLLRAQGNLAFARQRLGDLRGALVLEEKVLAARSKALPDDHPALQRARANLARTKYSLGDLDGALALDEQVLAVRSRTLPDDHLHLQAARQNLALTREALGDARGALELRQKVLEVWSKALPDDHAELQMARCDLAATKRRLGDPDAALAIEAPVVERWAQILPDDHPNLQVARRNLARTKYDLGDLRGALDLYLASAAAARARLTRWPLAPREVGAIAIVEFRAVAVLLALHEAGAPADRSEVLEAALLTAEVLRGAELRATRMRASARARDPATVEALDAQLRAAVAEVTRLGNVSLDGEGTARDASWAVRHERVAAAVRTKERIERQLDAVAGEARAPERTEELAARAPARSALVSILDLAAPAEQWRATPEASGTRMVALVLDRSAKIELRPLAPSATIDALVADIRRCTANAQRGERAEPTDELPLALRTLRRAVLDPVLAALPDGTDTLVLSLPESLQLAPLDALPLDSGEPLGTKYHLVQVASLLDLLEPAAAAIADAPTLLALGGIDYEQAPAAIEGAIGGSAAPPDRATRDGAPERFRALTDSDTEVRSIASAFARTFTDGEPIVLLGREASKHALVQQAHRATFLHFATHGYFAPESARSTADAAASGSPLSRFEFGIEDRISGLSPLVLTGLALAGANLPPDAFGRRDGIFTAEELVTLDLSRCTLATLSACDTSLGVRRAGQGFASLRAALQAAGARFVLATLWKVNDRHAMELMTDFYGRMWREHEDPHAALWAAKMALRAQGAPFRDWAGWVLSGR